MAFFNFLKPKWQHRDKSVRLTAVSGMSSRDTDTLLRIAGGDADSEVRLAAVARLADVEVLASLASAANDADFKGRVLARRNELLVQAVMAAQDQYARKEAFSRIDDPQVLVKITIEAEDLKTRCDAVELISDEKLLVGILEKPSSKEVSQAAFAKISDPGLLKQLAGSANSRAVRRFAAERLHHLEPVDPLTTHAKELAGLAGEAEKLVESRQWDKAANRFREIQDSWSRLDPDNRHPQKMAVDTAWAQFVERRRKVEAKRLDELKRAEEFTRETVLREAACQMVEELIGSLAGDADTRFEQVVAGWPATGGFVALSQRFSEACAKYKEAKARIVAEKKLFGGLVDECGRLERLVGSDEWQQVAGLLDRLATDLGEAKFTYMAKITLKDRLTAIRKRYTERLETSRAELDRQKEESMARRWELCAELEKYSNADNRQEAEKKVLELQAAWSALPQVSDPAYGECEKRFLAAMEHFRVMQKEFYSQQEWQLWANRNLKEELCGQVEALDNETDLAVVVAGVKAAQAGWKKIGASPRKEAERLWERFHAACERNFGRCEPYFAEQERMRSEVMSRKEEMCLEAERLADSTEWKETAQRLKELQNEWKTLATGPRHKEETLYGRFRQACNQFFSKSSRHFAERQQDLRQHLAEKIKLCEEIEAIVAAPQKDQAGRVRELMVAWKAVGNVPKEESEAIWQRFKAANDLYHGFLDSSRIDNLQLKEALCAKAEELTGAITEATDMRALAEKLVGLKGEWRQIGPAPEEKNEEVWQRFSKIQNDFFTLQREQLRRHSVEQRRNLQRKEEILQQAEELAARNVWDTEAADALRELERQWQEIGPAPKSLEGPLRDEFKGLCGAFFTGRREYFAERATQWLDNQRRKEILCLHLEKVLGVTVPEEYQITGKVLTLAEEMKLAMEVNFTFSGARDDEQRISNEVNRLKAEWQKIGPAPRQQDQILRSRFRRALDLQRSTQAKAAKPGPAAGREQADKL